MDEGIMCGYNADLIYAAFSLLHFASLFEIKKGGIIPPNVI